MPDSPELPVSDLAYPDAVAELEAIVSDLDEGAVDVDTLSERFQRAIDIVEELDARISKTRAQVQQLVPRLEAIGNASAETPGPEEAF